jgi:hypothetical protein
VLGLSKEEGLYRKLLPAKIVNDEERPMLETPTPPPAGEVDHTQMVEFVCNLPGTLDEIAQLVRETHGLCSGAKNRVFVQADPSWLRVLDNLLGPPYGEHADPAHIGVYDAQRPELRGLGMCVGHTAGLARVDFK